MKLQSILNLSATVLAAVTGVSAGAVELPVPRGHDTGASAGSCTIGTFEQTTKAGIYNEYCDDLTDAEKCLALIKQHMSQQGVLYQAHSEAEKVEYCLEVFKDGLVGED